MANLAGQLLSLAMKDRVSKQFYHERVLTELMTGRATREEEGP